MEPLTIPVVLQPNDQALVALLAATILAPSFAATEVDPSFDRVQLMHDCAESAVEFARILLAKAAEQK